MALGIVRRDPKVVSDKQVIAIRNALQVAISDALEVPPGRVEIEVRDVGPLDLNYKPVGIEVHTGTGKEGWRVGSKRKIGEEIATHLNDMGVLHEEWLGPEGSYLWLRICEGFFIPIGFPNHAR